MHCLNIHIKMTLKPPYRHQASPSIIKHHQASSSNRGFEYSMPANSLKSPANLTIWRWVKTYYCI